jgi:serine/threonine-protein kinase
MSTANSLTSGLDCASPESILEPTNRTPAGDQYSLGCTLYYFLTGRYPFPEGSTVEKMMAHQSKEPPPIQEFAPDVPGGLVEVVSRLMRKTQEERYPSTSDVVEALRPFAAESGPAPVVVSRPAAAPTVAPPGRETRPEPGRPRAPVSEPRTAPEPPRSAAPARSLRQQMFEQPPTATSLPALSEPEAEAPAVAPEQQAVPTPDYQQVPGKSLEDRIGPWGIIIIGLIIAAVAGFALWQMGFFK